MCYRRCTSSLRARFPSLAWAACRPVRMRTSRSRVAPLLCRCCPHLAASGRSSCSSTLHSYTKDPRWCRRSSGSWPRCSVRTASDRLARLWALVTRTPTGLPPRRPCNLPRAGSLWQVRKCSVGRRSARGASGASRRGRAMTILLGLSNFGNQAVHKARLRCAVCQRANASTLLPELCGRGSLA